MQTVRSDLQDRERDRQFESPGPCASGIHEKHYAYGIHSRSVGVPGDDDVDTGSGGIDVQRSEVMKHVEGPLGEQHALGLGVRASPIARIDIASDRRDRRNAAGSQTISGPPM